MRHQPAQIPSSGGFLASFLPRVQRGGVETLYLPVTAASWSGRPERATSAFQARPTAYQVRHTQASWLIDAGENPKAVMHRLGQAGLPTTARYVHVLDETGEWCANWPAQLCAMTRTPLPRRDQMTASRPRSPCRFRHG